MNQIRFYQFLLSLLLYFGMSPLTFSQGNAKMIFVEKHLKTGISLRGLCVVNEKIVWASGNKGTILKTTDGGNHWQNIPINGYENLDFRDVHAFDSLRAIIINAGSPAYVFSTEDGGKTWQKVYENTQKTAFLDDLAFDDTLNGLIFGDADSTGQFLALKTQDGGKNWQPLPSFFPTPIEKEAGFAASGSILHYQKKHIWVATGGGNVARLLYSKDEGKTWQIQTTPIRAGNEAQGIFSFCVLSTKQWIAVGGDYKEVQSSEKTAIYTQNSGKKWQLARQSPEGYRSGVAHFKDKIVVAVGTSGSSLSEDAGKSWYTLNTLNLNAIRFAPNQQCGYAVGRDGQIYQVLWLGN